MKLMMIFRILFFLLIFQLKVFSQDSKGPIIANNASNGSGQTWALVVGISKYQYVDSLRYADDDASAFYNYLLSPAGGSVPKSNIKLLLNQEATLAQIDRALGDLLDLVKTNDRVFIYFSGHGDQETKTISQRGFLLTADSFNSNYNSTAFAVLWLQDYIATLSTKNQAKVMVFLDACRSGKLAGNEIGGVQLTGVQLAKQVANEVKLMACQANEVSVEGKEWGGGRGIFSYHLIRGLQGLADNDHDNKVTLRELERYLEDHVTHEAAPIKQNPFLLAVDKSFIIANVDNSTIEALQKSIPIPSFLAVEGKSFIDDVLGKAGMDVQHWYEQFQLAIDEQRLVDTLDAAEIYYEKLTATPSIEKIHSFIKREFIAALLEDSQQIDKLLFLGLSMKDYLNDANKHQAKITSQLKKAAILLGKSHYLFNNISAKILDNEANLLEKKDRSKAIEIYKEALKFDSTYSNIYNNLGVLHYESDGYSEAKKYYKKAIEISPNWSFPYQNIALVLQNEKKYIEAEQYFKKAIEINPNFDDVFSNYENPSRKQKKAIKTDSTFIRSLRNKASFLNNYGGLLEEVKRYDEAELNYKKAIEINPKLESAYNNLGNLYKSQKRYDIAELNYKKAIEINPKYVYSYNGLGALYGEQKRYDIAESNYKKAIEINPKFESGYNNLGDLYTSQNRFDEAELNYKKAIEINSKFESAYNNLGNLYKSQKRYDIAELNYKKAIEINPKYEYGYNGLGALYEEQERYDIAESNYKKAIEINPKFENAYYNLGILYKEQERYDIAESNYKKAIEINPKFDYAYYNLGILYKEQKRYDIAESNYKKAIEINPKFDYAYYNLGILYKEQKRYDIAESNYKKAIEINPKFDYAYNNLGVLFEEQKQYDIAELNFKKAINCSPLTKLYYNNLQILLENKKEYAQIKQMYRKAIEINTDFEFAYNKLESLLDDEELITIYKTAISKKPQFEFAYKKLGSLLDERGKVEEEIEIYKIGVKNIPNFKEAYQHLGSLLGKLKRYNESEKYYIDLLNLDPKNDWILANLAYIQLRNNKLKEAEGNFLKALEYSLDSASKHYDLACYYAVVGNKFKAIKYLESAYQNGFSNYTHIKNDKDMNNIRETQKFKEILIKIELKSKENRKLLWEDF